MEIAASRASYDLHDKFQVYRRSGVQEYLVWLVQDGEFRWYVLEEGRYCLQAGDETGCLKSRVFPELWLDGPALLAGNMQWVLEYLQGG